MRLPSCRRYDMRRTLGFALATCPPLQDIFREQRTGVGAVGCADLWIKHIVSAANVTGLTAACRLFFHPPTLTELVIRSGMLEKGTFTLCSSKGNKERIGRLVEMHSNDRTDIDIARTGDIVAIGGLKVCCVDCVPVFRPELAGSDETIKDWCVGTFLPGDIAEFCRRMFTV